MEMTRFEKFFVNRELKGRRNASRIRRLLARADTNRIRDVLEIGCGIGTVSALFAKEYGWIVVGSDFDTRQIEAAKLRYPEHGRLTFRAEDATRLTFEDASFDLVIAQMVFHHISVWREAVTELARVVRPGGYVAWYDHVISPGMAAVAGPVTRRFGICERDDVARAFDDAGFACVVSNRFGPSFLSFDDALYRKSD